MTHNPEKALWQEVLLCQVDDALHGPSGVSGLENRIRAIKDARIFLTKPNRDFDQLCTLAGVEPDATRERLSKQIADAPPIADLAASKKVSRASLFKRPKETKPKQTKYVDRLITFAGETLTVAQWADRTGLTVTQIGSRLRQDWPIERALTQPIGQRNRGWGMTGGGSDFGASYGTGVGRSAQETPEISFSDSRKAS